MTAACAMPEISLRGAAAGLFDCREREVMLDGPSGTGKSVGACWYLIDRCSSTPGIRVLLSRKTRVSMSETILVTWEKALRLMGLSSMCSGATRHHRSHYNFPNGSEVVLFGFDDPERVKSSDYDLIYVNEGTELTLDDWEIALSRLRNNVLEYQQGIIDCNPGAPNHWLNQRANSGVMTRLLSRHEDNPMYYDAEAGVWTQYGKEYIENVLGRLTGARRSRLLLGLWVAAEGAVFEEVWDAARACIDASQIPMLPSGESVLRGHIGGADWGFRDPGVLQVWGYNGDKDMYRVREIYRAGQNIAWWERQAKCLMRDFPDISVFVCDPSQPAHIEQFVQSGIPAIGADRSVLRRQATILNSPLRGSIEVGIQELSERLKDARIFYVKGVVGWYDDKGEWVRGTDDALREAGHPVCTEDEYPLYAYPKSEDGKPIKEIPVDMFNHGIDCSRYVAMKMAELSVGLDVLPEYDQLLEAMA